MTSFSLNRIKKGMKFFFGIFFSRIFGFLRDMTMAFLFGGGFLTDSFNLAFKIPNIFRQIFGESMYERAFMPPFNRLRNAGRFSEARNLLLKSFLISQALVLGCMALIYFALPLILRILATGFEESALKLPLEMAQIFLPYMLLISLATFAGSLLRYTHRNEFLYGFSPAVQNILLMIVMVVFYRSLGIFSMVYGYLIGSFGFLCVQLPAVWKIWKELQQPDKNDDLKKEQALKNAFGQGGNLFFSSLLNKSIDLVDAAVASLTGFGAISALAYSRRIIDLPVTIFGMAFSTLPAAKAISDLKGKKQVDDIPATIAFGIKTQIFLLVPVSIFCLIFSRELMTIFFKRGAFDDLAVQQTSLAFAFFSLGMFPIGMRRFFGDIFPAIENARPLVWVSLIGAVVNIALDFILYQTPLKHGGIALATSISYTTQCLILLYFLKDSGISLLGQGWSTFFSRTALGLAGFVLLLFVFKMGLPEEMGFLALFSRIVVFGVVSMVLFLLITIPFLVKRKDDKLRLILTGGGTGGHVYPSLAVYELLKRQFEIEDTLYLGLKNKPEFKIVPRKGIAFKPIVSSPVAGLSPLRLLHALPVLVMGTFQSLIHILKFNPNTVVASGGYVSAPVVVAAAILRPFLKLKIILHEQNLVPGFMNKVASLLADITYVNFRESAFLMWSTRCVHAGYPVRSEFLEPVENEADLRAGLGIPGKAFFILIYGGSIGARSVNRALARALPELEKMDSIYIVHGVGLNTSEAYHGMNDTVSLLGQSMGERFDPESMAVSDSKGRVFYRAFDYLHDLGQYQKAADLIVCRAGAGALAEVMALGKPALVIPKRGLPGNHQELNAIELREKDACDLLFETYSPEEHTDIIDPKALVHRIALLRDDAQSREFLGKGAARQFFHNSERAVCEALDDMNHGHPVDYITTIEEPAVVRHQRLFDSLIDHLQELPEDHILRSYYRTRAYEYIKSSRFLTVNRGIKLISVFPEPELFDFVFEHFSSFKGFLKRNALHALSQAPHYDPRFCELVLRGIKDPYFEARREAIALFRRFYTEMDHCQEIHDAILKALNRRFLNFEVRVEAIRASVLILDQAGFESATHQFLFSQNMRLRYGLLLAIEDGLNLERITHIAEIRKFTKQILLTNADFVPNFKIREQFKRVASKLRATGDREEGDAS
jgi:murein biosynthesis integral membrane protein MurJ